MTETIRCRLCRGVIVEPSVIRVAREWEHCRDAFGRPGCPEANEDLTEQFIRDTLLSQDQAIVPSMPSPVTSQ